MVALEEVVSTGTLGCGRHVYIASAVCGVGRHACRGLTSELTTVSLESKIGGNAGLVNGRYNL